MRQKSLLNVVLIISFLSLFILPLAHASVNNIVDRYAFDEDFHDSTGNNNLHFAAFTDNGSVNINGITPKVGNGSLFNSGSASRGLQGAQLAFPDAMSVAAWVNLTSSITNYPVVAFTPQFSTLVNNFEFGLFSNRTIFLRMTNSSSVLVYSSSMAPSVPIANWTQIGFSMDGQTSVQFYINGVQYSANVASANTTNSLPVGITMNLSVGYERGIGTAGFAGKMDEVSIWHKSLTSVDFASLYNSGQGQAYPYTNISNHNFSVAYNSSNAMAVTDKVTVAENSTDFNYKYALTCDLSQQSLWNEQFNNFYNFSSQNVSTSFVNPQSYLTFQGIFWNNTVGVTTNFDILKTGNAGYRDFLTYQVSYQTNQNHYAETILYDGANNPALYLTLNKTGSLLIVRQYYPAFATSINIANFTLVGGNVNIQVELMPHHDTGTNTDDFLFTIKNSNLTGSQLSTDYETIGGVSTINNAELFSGNSVNGTTFYKSMSLTKTSNPHPSFREFQNGERENIGGVTIETPAPLSSVDGDGFTIIPDFNNVFYSICQYTTVGSYTQRHFLGATSSPDDWSNYHDLTITATQVSTNTSDETEGGAAGPGSGDFGTDIIPSFFNSVGFTSTASKLLIWMVVAFIIAAIGFGVHPILGVLVFVAVIIVGVPIGMVPLWFLLVFIIIAGGIVAALYRMIFSGS